MKQYVVFGFEAYYPCGGSNDIAGVVSAMNDETALSHARTLLKQEKYTSEYTQVVRIDDGGYTVIWDEGSTSAFLKGLEVAAK